MSGRKDVRKREIFSQKSLEAWHKITDWNAFAEFANEQGGKTQSEMIGAILVDKQFIEHLKI